MELTAGGVGYRYDVDGNDESGTPREMAKKEEASFLRRLRLLFLFDDFALAFRLSPTLVYLSIESSCFCLPISTSEVKNVVRRLFLPEVRE